MANAGMSYPCTLTVKVTWPAVREHACCQLSVSRSCRVEVWSIMAIGSESWIRMWRLLICFAIQTWVIRAGEAQWKWCHSKTVCLNHSFDSKSGCLIPWRLRSLTLAGCMEKSTRTHKVTHANTSETHAWAGSIGPNTILARCDDRFLIGLTALRVGTQPRFGTNWWLSARLIHWSLYTSRFFLTRLCFVRIPAESPSCCKGVRCGHHQRRVARWSYINGNGGTCRHMLCQPTCLIT